MPRMMKMHQGVYVENLFHMMSWRLHSWNLMHSSIKGKVRPKEAFDRRKEKHRMPFFKLTPIILRSSDRRTHLHGLDEVMKWHISGISAFRTLHATIFFFHLLSQGPQVHSSFIRYLTIKDHQRFCRWCTSWFHLSIQVLWLWNFLWICHWEN